MPQGHSFTPSVAPAHDPAARAQWARLCAGSQQHTVFSRLDFAELLGRAMRLPLEIGLVVDDAGRPRAGLLLYVKRRGPYRAAAQPVLSTVHTPVLDGCLSEADVHHGRAPLDALLELVASRVHQATLCLHPSLADVRPLAWHGWRLRPAYTYRISLDPTKAPTDGWSENPLRLLQRERAAHRVDEDPGAIDRIVDLVAASHRRGGERLALPPARLVDLAAELAAGGLARPFIARKGAEPAAGTILLSDGRTAYYWMAGSAPGAAMTVLLAEALERLRVEGVRHFDLVGANRPSIAEFKRRLGAHLVPYFRARVSTRPELRLLDRLRWA